MRGEHERICIKKIKKWACEKNDFRLLCLLESAKENSDSSAFPDFTLSDGFIEHFQVTAAEETRKGSKHNIAKINFTRDSKATFEQEKKEFLQSPPRENALVGTYDMYVKAYDMRTPEYSYENFVSSFKRNFDRHIKHLQSYCGDKTNGVFLIELVGAHVTILKNGQFQDFYRLSKDYDLLSYIYTYFEQVRYIIFADSDILE